MRHDDDKCTCDEEDQDDTHSCPFKEDINNDSETQCSCCRYCTRECAMDI